MLAETAKKRIVLVDLELGWFAFFYYNPELVMTHDLRAGELLFLLAECPARELVESFVSGRTAQKRIEIALPPEFQISP